MLRRINIEDPKEESKQSKVPSWITNFIQKLKDNKKIVIGVSIGVLFLGKAFNSAVALTIKKLLNLWCHPFKNTFQKSKL